MKPSAIGQNAIRTFAFSALSSAVGILTGMFLAKTLGPYGKGLFSGIQVLQGGISAATAGAGASIMFMLTNQRRSIGQLAKPLAALLIGTTLLAWIFLGLWALRYGLSTTLLVAAAVIPASIVLSWRNYFYMGIDRLRSLNYQGFGVTAAVLLTVVIAVQLLHRGVVGAIIAWAICTYVGALVVVIHAVRISQRENADFWQDLRSLIRFGARSALDGVLGFLNYRIDSLVLIAYLGAAGFGIYSVAVTGGELLFMISRAVNTAAAHDIGAFELGPSAELTAKTVRMNTAAMVILAAIASLVVPPLISVFYGSRFASAGVPLRILVAGVAIYASSGTMSAFFAFQRGRPMAMVYLSACTVALQVGLSLWLIPKFGMVGAATASTATYFLAALVLSIMFSRVTTMRLARVWIPQSEDLRSVTRALKSLLLRNA